MSQLNSWDSAEHFALVLELSKPVIYGAAVAALDKVLKYGLDYETPLHNTLVTWGRVLDTLTETQKAILEVERPGIVLRMSTNCCIYESGRLIERGSVETNESRGQA